MFGCSVLKGVLTMKRIICIFLFIFLLSQYTNAKCHSIDSNMALFGPIVVLKNDAIQTIFFNSTTPNKLNEQNFYLDFGDRVSIMSCQTGELINSIEYDRETDGTISYINEKCAIFSKENNGKWNHIYKDFFGHCKSYVFDSEKVCWGKDIIYITEEQSSCASQNTYTIKVFNINNKKVWERSCIERYYLIGTNIWVVDKNGSSMLEINNGNIVFKDNKNYYFNRATNSLGLFYNDENYIVFNIEKRKIISLDKINDNLSFILHNNDYYKIYGKPDKKIERDFEYKIIKCNTEGEIIGSTSFLIMSDFHNIACSFLDANDQELYIKYAYEDKQYILIFNYKQNKIKYTINSMYGILNEDSFIFIDHRTIGVINVKSNNVIWRMNVIHEDTLFLEKEIKNIVYKGIKYWDYESKCWAIYVKTVDSTTKKPLALELNISYNIDLQNLFDTKYALIVYNFRKPLTVDYQILLFRRGFIEPILKIPKIADLKSTLRMENDYTILIEYRDESKYIKINTLDFSYSIENKK